MLRPAKLAHLCIPIALCAMQSLAQEPQFPEELSAGKNIAVLVRPLGAQGVLPSDFADNVRSRIVDEIRKHKRFEVVESPSDADLVCVYVVLGPRWVERRKKGRALIAASSMFVLKGNANQHWDAGPLWFENSPSDDWIPAVSILLNEFHRSIAKGKGQRRRAPPPASSGASKTSVFLACRYYDCPLIQARAAERWNIVDTPSRADLVVVWFPPSTLLSLELPGHFVLFRGDRADWDTMPLLAGIADTFDWLLALLETQTATAVAYLVESNRVSVSVRQDLPMPERKAFSLRPETRPAEGSIMKVFEESDRATRLFPAEPGMAVIYVAREHSSNRELVPITLDGEKLFDIEEGTYIKAIAAPGFHTIAASGGGSARNELNWYMEAGAVYFVMINGHTLTRVNEIDPSRILSVIP